MNHEWQSESTDELKGGWSCVFFLSGCNGHLTHKCSDVAWCSAIVVVVVAYRGGVVVVV